jgi:hypothetical protein
MKNEIEQLQQQIADDKAAWEMERDELKNDNEDLKCVLFFCVMLIITVNHVYVEGNWK